MFKIKIDRDQGAAEVRLDDGEYHPLLVMDIVKDMLYDLSEIYEAAREDFGKTFENKEEE